MFWLFPKKQEIPAQKDSFQVSLTNPLQEVNGGCRDTKLGEQVYLVQGDKYHVNFVCVWLRILSVSLPL